MVFNLLFRVTLNAYVLYKQTVRRPVSRERFMEMLVEALAEETVAAKRSGVHTPYWRQPLTNGRRRLVPLRGIDFITASYFVPYNHLLDHRNMLITYFMTMTLCFIQLLKIQTTWQWVLLIYPAFLLKVGISNGTVVSADIEERETSPIKLCMYGAWFGSKVPIVRFPRSPAVAGFWPIRKRIRAAPYACSVCERGVHRHCFNRHVCLEE